MMVSVQSCGSKKGDKAEYKKWKKKAKYYKKNPMALKAKEEGCQKEIAALTQKNKELNQRIQALQKELDDCVTKYEQLLREKDAKYDSLVYEFKKLQTAVESRKVVTMPTDESQPVKEQVVSQPIESGIMYRVQIGAYAKFKIDDRLANTEKNFTGESMDGLNKYMIGRFRNYESAREFRRDIIKLGIRDAFVVAYNDGVRITVSEALRKQGKK